MKRGKESGGRGEAAKGEKAEGAKRAEAKPRDAPALRPLEPVGGPVRVGRPRTNANAKMRGFALRTEWVDELQGFLDDHPEYGFRFVSDFLAESSRRFYLELAQDVRFRLAEKARRGDPGPYAFVARVTRNQATEGSPKPSERAR